MRHLHGAAGAIAALTIGLPVVAQQPDTLHPHAVQPERPTVATHAGTVARGWWEIETGLEHDRIGSSTTLLVPTVLKVGVASHVQVEVFGSAEQPATNVTGLGDFGVNVKWRLLDDAPVLGDFAVEPGIKLPTASRSSGLGTGTTDLLLLLISSHEFGPVAMDLNAGYAHRSGNGTNTPKNATVWTASFGGSAVGPVGWVAELYGYPATSGPAGQASIVSFLVGPTFLPREWLFFDAGIIRPIRGPQPRALYAGTVINLGRLW